MNLLALAATVLQVTVWPQGLSGDSERWTLRCSPTGGNHPRAAAACRTLARLQAPFAPVPRDAVCTEIYGGPAVARVTGTHRGRRVWATFQRRNGCEIARWDRVAVLFPGTGTGTR
jgi:hypothetical protein